MERHMHRFLGRSRASEDWRGAVLGLACIALLAAAGIFMDVGAFAAIAFCLAIVAGVVPTRIDVGDDGVRVGWLGSRFFPFRSVSTVERAGRDAVLTLKSGARVVLPIAPRRRPGTHKREDLLTAQKREDLVTRLHSALRDYENEVSDTRALETALARQSRTAAGVGDAYRTLQLEPDALWRLVETPSVPTRSRVEAAAHLSLDEEGRRRIRIAAQASALPTTRITLGRVAERPLDEEESSAHASSARAPRRNTE
jgi:hypothetical protein